VGYAALRQPQAVRDAPAVTDPPTLMITTTATDGQAPTAYPREIRFSYEERWVEHVTALFNATVIVP